MSFEGLGSKMIINKSTDVARDTASQQKQAEIMQMIAQKRKQAEDLIEQSQVRDVYQPSETLIQRERDKDKREQKKSDDQKAKGAETRDTELPRPESKHNAQAEHKIDIRI